MSVGLDGPGLVRFEIFRAERAVVRPNGPAVLPARVAGPGGGPSQPHSVRPNGPTVPRIARASRRIVGPLGRQTTWSGRIPARWAGLGEDLARWAGPLNSASREDSFTMSDGRRDQTLRSTGCERAGVYARAGGPVESKCHRPTSAPFALPIRPPRQLPDRQYEEVFQGGMFGMSFRPLRRVRFARSLAGYLRGEGARQREDNPDHESRRGSSRACVVRGRKREPQRASGAWGRVGGRWRHRTPGGGLLTWVGLLIPPAWEQPRENCWPFGLAVWSGGPPVSKKSPPKTH